MASKKILLEVLSADRQRVASPPRPRKEERRREKPARSIRPCSIPLPSTRGLLLVLGGVVAIVVSFGVGYWRGNRRAEAAPALQTKAADLWGEADGDPTPSKSIGGNANAGKSAASPRWGIQLVSYEPGEKNVELARNVKKELAGLGLLDVEAWQTDPPGPRTIFLTVGSFLSKEDPALATLLEKVRTLSLGKEKAPFAGARVRELPRVP